MDHRLSPETTRMMLLRDSSWRTLAMIEKLGNLFLRPVMLMMELRQKVASIKFRIKISNNNLHARNVGIQETNLNLSHRMLTCLEIPRLNN